MIIDSIQIVNKLLKNSKTKSYVLEMQKVYPALALIRTSKKSYHKYYMNTLKRLCKECDIKLNVIDILNDNKEEAIQVIDKLNGDFHTHGIVLETPNEELANNIVPFKDLDCLSIPNVGSLMTEDDITQPCIAKGIFAMLNHYKVDYKHSKVLILTDDSNRHYIRYINEMFRREKATITIANSRTRNLSSLFYDSNIILIANNKINSVGYELLEDVNNEIEQDIIHGILRAPTYVIDLDIHKNSINEITGNIQYNNMYEVHRYGELNYVNILPAGEYINLGLFGLIDNLLTCATIQNKMLKRTNSCI